MSQSKIRFRNEPFMARVAGRGDQPIRCTPVVYDEMSNCGVGVLYESGGGSVWGLVSPRNLIAAWRATEVLRLLDTIEAGTLCAAYYTGLRAPHESEKKSYVEPMIAKIGRTAYEQIMAMPVPEPIIRAILDSQKDDFAPNLYPITDEVRAGTIQWREEFAAAEIKHPDEVDAKEREDKATIARFEPLLASYADARNMPRHCLGMGGVEGALLELVSKGVGQSQSDHVLVALAGVVGALDISAFTMAFIVGSCSDGDADAQVERTKREAITASATWLMSMQPRRRLWLPWKRREQAERLTAIEITQLLSGLLEEHFPTNKKRVAATA